MTTLDKQQARTKRESDLKVNGGSDAMMMGKTLPSYFHNIGSRMAVSNHNQKTLRVNSVPKTSYVNKSTMLTLKKEFRVDPATRMRVGTTT